MKKHLHRSGEAVVLENNRAVLSDVLTITRQVVCVEISGDTGEALFTDGIDFLQSKHFCSVAPLPKQRSHVLGIAPRQATDLAILFEYAPNELLRNMPFTMYAINHCNKHIVETGRIMFSPEEKAGQVIFSVIGDKMKNWDITTSDASPELLARAALFADGKKTITIEVEEGGRGDGNGHASIELVETIDENGSGASTKSLSLHGIIPEKHFSRIERLGQQNPLFAEFVKNHCNGDVKVTSVIDGIEAYMKEKAITLSAFILELNAADAPILIRQLYRLRNLDVHFRPFLDLPLNRGMKRSEKNVDRLNIEMAALLAQFPKDRQVAIWEEAKKKGSSYFVALHLKNALESANI